MSVTSWGGPQDDTPHFSRAHCEVPLMAFGDIGRWRDDARFQTAGQLQACHASSGEQLDVPQLKKSVLI